MAIVSPRNYFLYTPLLPAMAVGTMEERSIVEPVRRITYGKAEYFEATVKEVDIEDKELIACFPEDAGLDEACFRIPYDVLVIGVGSVNNTFGIKGVMENCFLFKTIDDANALRRRVSECFERASLPYTDEARKRQLLSFVIVGGGPTGVEVAAELYDSFTQDLSKLYPSLTPYMSIKVIELTSHLLGMYDRKISEYTSKVFSRSGIETILNTKVIGVETGSVTIQRQDGGTEEIPFGACVWATGVAMNPVVKKLQQVIPEQNHFRSVITDTRLCAKGSGGSIFAMGDAATIEQDKALDYAAELYDNADRNQDGKLQYNEVRDVIIEASKRFPHLEEHARFLRNREGQMRWGATVMKALEGARRRNKADSSSPLTAIDERTELSREEFEALLKQLDLGLRALPATAQVAKQHGEFLATLFGKYDVTPDTPLPPGAPEFKYVHKGSTAYVGSDRAVFDLPIGEQLFGIGAGYLWKSFETFSQFSWRNRVLVTLDWVRTKLFGRDISRV